MLNKSRCNIWLGLPILMGEWGGAISLPIKNKTPDDNVIGKGKMQLPESNGDWFKWLERELGSIWRGLKIVERVENDRRIPGCVIDESYIIKKNKNYSNNHKNCKKIGINCKWIVHYLLHNGIYLFIRPTATLLFLIIIKTMPRK